MNDIAHVMCFKDHNKGKIKAVQFVDDGFNVIQILKADIVLCDDFKTSPKAFTSAGEFDWLVVIATKSDVVGEGPGIVIADDG